MTITITKNFLDKDLLNEINQKVFSQEFPWYWRDKMVNGDHYWFNHTFYRHGTILSPHYSTWIEPILKKLNCKVLIEARCNMNTKEKEHYTSDLHTDFNSPKVKTSLLYLNTCNGGTIVIDPPKERFIESEANKIIIFPCEYLHRGVMQTDTIRRAVININYE